MSGLAKVFEEEGLSTALVALVREQAQAMSPPRALWVSFPLGRPLGAANDSAFQKRVLRALLGLYDQSSGPLLIDHDEDMPEEAPRESDDGWVCPVSFPRPVLEGETALLTAVLDEIAALAPWYARSKEKRGRTTVGLSGKSPEEAARFIATAFGDIAGGTEDLERLADALRYAADDLTAYYLEAATARPGDNSTWAVNDWIWRETSLGDLLRAVRQACLAEEEGALFDLGDFMLVPEGYEEVRIDFA